MRLPVDISVLVLSHTSSSILCGNGGGCILRTKVASTEPMEPSLEEAGGEEVDLGKLRNYWSVLRLSEVSMDPAAAELAEEDFVSARQDDQTVTSDDFHSWLVVARLLALSYGHSSVSEATWRRMKELEKMRLQGLRES